MSSRIAMIQIIIMLRRNWNESWVCLMILSGYIERQYHLSLIISLFC